MTEPTPTERAADDIMSLFPPHDNPDVTRDRRERLLEILAELLAQRATSPG